MGIIKDAYTKVVLKPLADYLGDLAKADGNASNSGMQAVIRDRLPFSNPYPTGRSKPGSGNGIDFATLRRFSVQYDVARAAINRRKRQLNALEWDIVNAEADDQADNSAIIKYQTRITFKTNGGISTSGSKQKFSFQLLGLSSDVSIYFDADVSNYWCTHFSDGNLIDSHYTTSVLVDDSDFYLKIVVNQTSTYFYINNVLVRTETHGSSDLSKGTVYENAFTINITNTKLDNGSTIGFECDAVKLEQTLSVDRQFT